MKRFWLLPVFIFYMLMWVAAFIYHMTTIIDYANYDSPYIPSGYSRWLDITYSGIDILGIFLTITVLLLTLAGIAGLILNKSWYRLPLILPALAVSIMFLLQDQEGLPVDWVYCTAIFFGFVNLAIFMFFSGESVVRIIRWIRRPKKVST